MSAETRRQQRRGLLAAAALVLSVLLGVGVPGIATPQAAAAASHPAKKVTVKKAAVKKAAAKKAATKKAAAAKKAAKKKAAAAAKKKAAKKKAASAKAAKKKAAAAKAAAAKAAAAKAAAAKKKAATAKAAAVRAAAARPEGWVRRTVTTTRGQDSIGIQWPARARATGYTVTWSPTTATIPSSPNACVNPCKSRWTKATAMTLSSVDLSTPGNLVSSASGNSVHLKVFSHNGAEFNSTGITYPWDSWVTPERTETVDWVLSPSAQMPAPLPPVQGLDVAVTSFNVLAASSGGPSWADRAPKVVDQINATGASVVATQENSNSPTGVASGSGQYADLAARLAPHGWVLADDRDWDRELGLPRSRSTQATRTFYKAAEWDQVARGALLTHVPVSGQTEGVNVDRWVSWVKLRSTTDLGVEMCVLNAHLISNMDSNARTWAEHRNAEIAQVRSELNNAGSTVQRVGVRVGAACSGTPTVFAGDFNSAQGHAPYGNQPQATMIGDGFVDTKNAGVRYNTRMSGTGAFDAWHEAWGTQIDYVLTKGMGGAKSFKVDAAPPGSTGSDHYPVTARISVPAT